MADIELVIKISESRYRLLQKQARTSLGREKLGEFEEAVLNGITLPKGHGRLIDADEIQFENTDFDTYGDYSRAFDAIDQADIIIEADKEKE